MPSGKSLFHTQLHCKLKWAQATQNARGLLEWLWHGWYQVIMRPIDGSGNGSLGSLGGLGTQAHFLRLKHG
ncbi:hypothetical protein Pyn_18904 [Prunus yedoensis var. nudiflora]|uniref:Uncharacterized protein n=1 Tax=Prunus yedoensis var. nudiflora TaxID=2094558 RepID=A0A314YXF3_PRUYE|nr:hypothetical protein Pyn_18904 [Prunus yedoensis var. nudiflora]